MEIKNKKNSYMNLGESKKVEELDKLKTMKEKLEGIYRENPKRIQRTREIALERTEIAEWRKKLREKT